mgnify:CR=1 FL=1
MQLIRAKSKTGQLVDFEVDRIVSIDGEPYVETAGQLRDHLLVIEGRLQAVENIIQPTATLAGV